MNGRYAAIPNSLAMKSACATASSLASHLTLPPNHMDCFDALQRAPRTLKRAVAFGQPSVFLHGSVILLNHVGLILAWRKPTDRLIPLYAIGAFLAFTLSQAGMVAHLNVPVMFDLASSCVLLSFVPYVIDGGVAQVSAGAVFVTARVQTEFGQNTSFVGFRSAWDGAPKIDGTAIFRILGLMLATSVPCHAWAIRDTGSLLT